MPIPSGEYELSAENGDLWVRTKSAGIAGAVGHDLTLIVDDWTGTVVVGKSPASCSLGVVADLRSLRVVDGAGGAKPLTDRDRDEIVRNAQKSLKTTQHPSLNFTTTTITGDWNEASIAGDLTLAGERRSAVLAVEQSEPSTFVITATVRQSAFGIKPYSAMLGALRVADDVEIEVAVTF